MYILCMHADMCASRYVCMSVYMYVIVRMNACTYSIVVCLCKFDMSDMQACMYVCMCVCIHMLMHVCLHMYVCEHVSLCFCITVPFFAFRN